jgi:O-antigen/teichoic acid export membrane protein
MNKRKKSIKVNAAFNTLKTLLSVAFPLITFPYVSRVIGVNQLGKYNFANSVISYFLLLAALGISSYAIREGTQYRKNQTKINEFASEMFSLNIVSTVVSYIILFICLMLVRRFDACRTEIIIFSIEIIATTFGVEWIYNIYEDFVFIAIRSFIFQCLSLTLLFSLVRGPEDLDKYVLITVISTTGNNIFNGFHAKRYCKIRFTPYIDWKRHLKPILIIFSTSVAVTIYVNSDTTMLGFLVNDRDYTVGIYGVATKIYTIFKNVVVAFLVVMIPCFSLLVHEEDGKRKVSNFFNKLSTILITVASPMIFGMIMLAPDIIMIVSGKQYLQAVTSFRILMAACYFSFFAYLFAQCILIPNKKEKDFFVATAIAAVANIGFNFVLIPFTKEIGTAITTLVAEFITMTLVVRASRNYVDFKLNKRDILSVIVGVISIVCICAFGNIFINIMILRVIGCIVVSALSYYAILKGLKNSVVGDIETTLKNRIHIKESSK